MPEAGDAGDERYLVVALGTDDFALDARIVRELLHPPRLTRVPGAPLALAGLANLRGAAMPVLDLRRLMHPEREPLSNATRVVVVEVGEPVGLLVDRVVGFAEGRPAVNGDDATGFRRLSLAVGTETVRLVDLAAVVAKAFPSRASQADGGTGRSRAEVEATIRVEAERVALVSFTAGGRSYALPLERVSEVLALPPDIVPVPRADAAALGVIPLRGGVLPLLSLAALLGLDVGASDGDGRVVVARLGGAETGLFVDALGPILRLPAEAVDPVPAALRRGGATAVDAICRAEADGTLVSVLSADRLLEGTTVNATHERTAEVARSDTGAATEQFVVFDLAGESYGLSVASVREVLRVPEAMARLPRSPDFVAGVIGVRGTVLAVIDQRRRFALPPGEADARRRIVVLDLGGATAGLLVDGVSRLVRLPITAIRPAPGFSEEAGAAVASVASLDDGGLLPIVDAHGLLVGTEKALRSLAKRTGNREPTDPAA
ncbi:chemotaxis protein CheW [Methylobacterium nigriterrae]|uniref:chemotaxis protein CheW n=1 Tax=Methylobacterium nigriterrae TaxID=3127512 RepID=UPI0030141A97